MRPRGSAHGLVAAAAIALILVGCATHADPATTAPASGANPATNLTISGTGFTPCGEVPAYACVYAIEMNGPDGVVHEAWFDYPKTTSPTLVTGDVPAHVDPGTWRFVFRQQRVSDTGSFEPVPSGTPKAEFGTVTLSTCETTFMVGSDVQVTVAVDFGPSPCAASFALRDT